MKKINWIWALFALAPLFWGGCNKDDGVAYMTVKMTDAPARYANIYVEIREFQIHYSTGETGWVTLRTRAGIYDLLTLQNDITEVLVNNADIRPGKVDQVRLLLGENNTLIAFDGSYDLTIPSGLQTGIKINLNIEMLADKTTEIILDFDASSSIVINGDGTYSLKPVIKVKSVTQF